jgi:hypothetical protein
MKKQTYENRTNEEMKSLAALVHEDGGCAA